MSLEERMAYGMALMSGHGIPSPFCLCNMSILTLHSLAEFDYDPALFENAIDNSACFIVTFN